ncbi:MAG TPA: sn-glycerol-3-phosphate ABC transporter ATP-binding protein UgpC [Gaiellaceae bacterium]|nr:sn-glycerol-3-phosphate ABC transporter ATP-binding protein UgpC [Gaiellaceae bacterium]
MARIEFDDVTKVYEDGTEAVSDLDLSIEDKELLVMVGPSGCGKTTALRMVAGLEEITYGEIRIGDKVVNDLTPKERDIAMVFQNYALYPQMTVRENLAFGLTLRHLSKDEVNRRVESAAKTLEIDDLLDRKPRALSGGQRQRVAMGRAIVRDPQAYLMDEPLSNLDAKLRVQMRAEIHQLQQREGVTTIYVTHDQIEAMTMGDRVAVMSKGRLQQVDTPQHLYDDPVNEFVAGFIGSPAINLLDATLQQNSGGFHVSFGDNRLPVDPSIMKRDTDLAAYAGRPVILGIRPENFADAALTPDAPPETRLKVDCILTEPLGSEIDVHFTTSGQSIVSSAAENADDASVHLGSEGGENVANLVARVSPRSRIATGQPAELAVDVTRLYFFDPDTRQRI